MSAYSPSAGVPFPCMSGQPSYLELFPSGEIPHTFFTYQWWEDEATTVFWAFDPHEIKRVIRFGLFRDNNLPRKSLQKRDPQAITAFLYSLVEPHEMAFIDNLSHYQKVEEIIRRCQISGPPLEPWSWLPTKRDSDLPSIAIAEAIDTESHLHFTRISFEELVRYFLGYRAPSVEWFLQQHTALYIHLLNYLQMFPEELGKYKEVEQQHLQTRSPFAHRAINRCLHAMRQPVPASPPYPGFQFIAAPIQQLFKEHLPSLKAILLELSVLGVRFTRTYVHAREMNWTKPFSVEIPLLDELDLTNPAPALDFAKTTTAVDEEYFSGLSHKSFVEPDAIIKRLLVLWELRSLEVWECCTGLPDMIGYIQEIVEALYTCRNYHSFTSILSGLYKYSTSHSTFTHTDSATNRMTLTPVLPPALAYLLDPTENFVAYRQEFQTSPGLPFLFPHIREYQQHGPPALHQLFQQLQRQVPTN
ncbi:uncharacterized protein BO96DRAFT_325270 [Aspergillus niger CBS 101883]|uniref:uncharacterized protein n=1 Tax=Aspergillus lacticoffeatus (strain CBS 101883) TaxID=1450533 RepID=UPI000D7F99A9|nr:uncharacterized protein BO96DRAFT_325270 [Aspergillus niger CBS 101883]PYH61953.1 hypothetical protein BO96DRAFT_325270 [Aspergillus niger CBS 101883]